MMKNDAEYMRKIGEKTRFQKGEKQRAISRMGGIAAAKNRAEKRELKAELDKMVALPMKKGKIDDAADFDYIDKDKIESSNLNIQQKLLLRLINDALKGNMRAMEQIFRIMGVNDNLQVNANVQVDDNKEIVRIAKLMETDKDFQKKLLGEE